MPVKQSHYLRVTGFVAFFCYLTLCYLLFINLNRYVIYDIPSECNCSCFSVFENKQNRTKNSTTIKRNTTSILNFGFTATLTKDTFPKMLDVVKTFIDICEYHNITYMMYGGTLIGSYRHHGIVPWDDDLDFLIPLKQKSQLDRAASKHKHRYMLIHLTDKSKLYSYTAERHNSFVQWNWPFVDIFYYEENYTHIWDSSHLYRHQYIYSKKNVFPLKRRPFLNMMLSAPFHTRKVLDKTYNLNVCAARYYDHKLEKLTTGKVVDKPCRLLFDYYPFVKHTIQGTGILEELVWKDTVVQWFQFSTDANLVTFSRNTSVDIDKLYMQLSD